MPRKTFFDKSESAIFAVAVAAAKREWSARCHGQTTRDWEFIGAPRVAVHRLLRVWRKGSATPGAVAEESGPLLRIPAPRGTCASRQLLHALSYLLTSL